MRPTLQRRLSTTTLLPSLLLVLAALLLPAAAPAKPPKQPAKPYCARTKTKKAKKERKLPKVCAKIEEGSAGDLFWQDRAWRVGEFEISGGTTYDWAADGDRLSLTGNSHYVGNGGSTSFFDPAWTPPPLTGDDWEDDKRPKDLPKLISLATVAGSLGETESKARYHRSGDGGIGADYDCSMKTDEQTRSESLAITMTENGRHLDFEMALAPPGWACPAGTDIDYRAQKWPETIGLVAERIPIRRLIDAEADDVREITLMLDEDRTFNYGDGKITQWWKGELTLVRPQTIIDVKKPPRRGCGKRCPL